MTLCYLGLGSNLCCPKRQLNQAIAHLRKMPHSVIVKISNFYFNPPFGLRAQPPYFNLVIAIQTSLPPLKLLHYCQSIENKQKRLRKKRWGARTLDIDILFYGEFDFQKQNLSIPHSGVSERDFVRIPLLELSPSPYILQTLKFS